MGTKIEAVHVALTVISTFGARELTALANDSSIYVVINVCGQEARTTGIVPTSQFYSQWQDAFDLAIDQTCCLSFRIYGCWKTFGLWKHEKLIARGHINLEHVSKSQDASDYIIPLCNPNGSHTRGHLTFNIRQIDGLNHIAKATELEITQSCPEITDRKLDTETVIPPADSKDTPQQKQDFLTIWNLANELNTCFKRQGDIAILQQAIVYYTNVLEQCPKDYPDRPVALNDLSNALLSRFQHCGDVEDLNSAIKFYHTMLDSIPDPHDNRSVVFNNIASALSSRFNYLGNFTDLEEAIAFHRKALELRSSPHPLRPMSLTNLASSLSTRFTAFGDVKDLEESIAHLRSAIELRPVDHPSRSFSLNSLGIVLSSRFDKFGKLVDLQEAIECHRSALNFRPLGHPDRPLSLNNLATVLTTRFLQLGDLADLEEAIECLRMVLVVCPPGHYRRPSSLNNLASALFHRFQQLNDVKDLQEAIDYSRSALALHRPEQPDYIACLNNVANALIARFQSLGEELDLHEAIECHRKTLNLHPASNPARFRALTNLAIALVCHFRLRSNVFDIDEAIQHLRSAADLCPHGHPDHLGALANLAIAHWSRFERIKDTTDLASVFDLLRAAVRDSPPGHPVLRNVYATLGSAYQHSLPEQPSDLDEAFRYFELATAYTSGGMWRQFIGAKAWASAAEVYSHSSILRAYGACLSTLDRYITSAPTVLQRFDLVKRASASLAPDAASCAARHNEPITAVEFLEHGRGLAWTHLARLRTPLDELRTLNEHGCALATQFQRISAQLNGSTETADYTDMPQNISSGEAQRRLKLAADWESVVASIREIEGFSRFLMPPLYSDLREAARDGPVIMVNASKHSCDAFIVLYTGQPRYIRLRDVTFNDVSHLASSFTSLLENSRKSGPIPQKEKQLIDLLRQLWSFIVEPIVAELASLGQQVPIGSRIWWCPTSTVSFLPLHAAGSFRKGEPNLSQLYISSYTPTLSALIRARRTPITAPDLLMFAAIGQGEPGGDKGGGRALPSVNAELDLVKDLMTSQIPFTCLKDTSATSNAALLAFSQNNFVHLACHGVQDPLHPYSSHFAMSDGPVSLVDLIQADLNNPQFAFLSACHTAKGDTETPDEVVHLAAGMQFAGFKSVVGTLWAVDDSIAPHIVGAFYRNFFSGSMDCTTAAVALYKAVKTVDKTKVPLEQRIVFIHIGA
ncbi:CHAT domain-containing protein [Hygrophoropsis aurantiaca]|uniref:CHAT domain-containing protein n=1 Tax=Hygrophoropsis aurantiaca TaxID=72124 RepID=A0ACB8AH43_9AGAM|nr:CHAT domain-containing protein [Hygrophoropsis aurantiaca]